jgi:hypothetical protein
MLKHCEERNHTTVRHGEPPHVTIRIQASAKGVKPSYRDVYDAPLQGWAGCKTLNRFKVALRDLTQLPGEGE